MARKTLTGGLLLAAIFLVLLAMPSFSAEVSLSKSVSGEKIVDFGGSLRVAISFSSGVPLKLDRLEDPIPLEFSAMNYPPSCAFSSGLLTCPFGYTGQNTTIEYDLVAVGAGQKVVFLPARLYYRSAEGLDESKVSNEIDGIYYVGRSFVNTTATLLQVDGEDSLQAFVLPSSKLKVGVIARNAGALPAENVAINFSIPKGWALSSGSSYLNVGNLSSGESRGLVATLQAPAVANFTEGSAEIYYNATWRDSGRSLSFSTPVLVFLTRPIVEAKRTIVTKWRRIPEGGVEPILEMEISLRNSGSAEASVTIAQDTVPSTKESTLAPSLKMQGKTERKLKALSVVSSAKITVPAGLVNYTDALGNSYPGTVFREEAVEIRQSLFAAIYLMTMGFFPFLHLAALVGLLGGLILLPFFGKNKYLLAAIGAITIVCALIVVSTAIVWFGL